jgi:hypothetical protein
MKRTQALPILSAALIGLCGVFQSVSQAAPGATPASKNSFQETTSRLDTGGDFFLYLSTQQWLDGLATKVSTWRLFFAGMPNLTDKERETLNKGFDVASRVIMNSGVQDVSGIGMSSLVVEKDLYRNKVFLHHYPGKGKGLLWNMMGSKPHPLAQLDLLPADTVLAISSDFDAPLLWSEIREEVSLSGFSEAKAFLNQLPMEFEKAAGLSWDNFLASLGGEFGVVLTMNRSNQVAILVPGTKGDLQIPEPALMLITKVKDDVLFNRLAQELQRNGGDKVIRVETPTLKMRSLALPLPIQMQVHPTVALSGGYLFVASSEAIVQEALAVKAGQKAGLKAQDEFKFLAKDIPAEGNGFSFVSERFGQCLVDVQKKLIDQTPERGARKTLLRSLIDSQKFGFGYAVNVNTDEGWLSISQGNQGQAKALLMSAAVVPTAVSTAMMLPALAKAKQRAQHINCANNLKQLSLAARIYGVDYNGHFPKDFVSMKNEINNPKLLICPEDSARHAASDWSSFNPEENSSYELLAPGASDDEPNRVFLRCKVHGYVGLTDGSVQQVPKNSPKIVGQGDQLHYQY